MPVTKKTAKRVLRRGKSTCVGCGLRSGEVDPRSGKKVIIQAAHKDDVQDPEHPLYYKADGCECRCIRCHARQHLKLARLSKREGNKKLWHHHRKAARLVLNTRKSRISWRVWWGGLYHAMLEDGVNKKPHNKASKRKKPKNSLKDL